jgi:hypothetical protein
MDGIFEVEGILTENDCDRLIEIYNENIKHTSPGEVSQGGTSRVSKDLKDTMDIFLPIMDIPMTHAGVRIVHDACHRTFTKYLEHFREMGLDRGDHECYSILDTFMKTNRLTNPQIQKVKPGGKFNWHSDCGLGHIVQFIFYLNDDYDGGRTEFSNGRIIEPKKGKVVIIPCTPQALHRGNIVTRGTKYISAVYLQFPPDY